ncbi:hypothetical protein B0H10DRAFT_1939177 [Mycena sp. CBHHK59/15]|nr:hypothetical protein B0H10DRAFT_1939177 [Mycena sp. CBHHK59/15]
MSHILPLTPYIFEFLSLGKGEAPEGPPCATNAFISPQRPLIHIPESNDSPPCPANPVRRHSKFLIIVAELKPEAYPTNSNSPIAVEDAGDNDMDDASVRAASESTDPVLSVWVSPHKTNESCNRESESYFAHSHGRD